MGTIIHPLLPDAWIRKTLGNDDWLMARVNNEIWEEDEVNPSHSWPFIVFKVLDGTVSLSSEKRPFVGTWEVQVRAVMRKDKLPAGVKGLRSYLAPATAPGVMPQAGIVGAILNDLQGVSDPNCAVGRIWGSVYLGEIRRAYTQENIDVLELGGRFRLQGTAAAIS